MSKVTPAQAEIASTAEAEAGTLETKFMTPGKTKEAIEALGGGRILLEEQTADADSTIEFTNHIDGTYRKYRIEFDDLIFSSSGSAFRMRVSSDGGVSFDDGASDYDYAAVGRTSAASTTTWQSSAATFINLAASNGDSDNETTRGWVELENVTDTAYTMISFHSTQNDGSQLRTAEGAGMRVDAAIVDAVNFFASSGTITSGTLRLIGYN